MNKKSQEIAKEEGKKIKSIKWTKKQREKESAKVLKYLKGKGDYQ
jgi:hypothetical protein